MRAADLGRPRFLLTGRPWRALWYVALGALGGLPVLALVRGAMALETEWGLPVAVAGLLGMNVLLALPVSAAERRRLKIVDGRVAPSRGCPWRLFGYTLVFTTVIAVVDLVALVAALCAVIVPLSPVLEFVFEIEPIVNVDGPVSGPAAVLVGVVFVPVVGYLVVLLALGQAAVARRCLTSPEAWLADQVQELSHSRSRLVDAFEAERTRIERNLHDGAQQRLVALIMTLGLAELELSGVSEAGARLVARARSEAEGVLAELRELIRGIRPQVLTDRGLPAAVTELADRCPLAVDVRFTLPRRPCPQVELAAYFVVSEALANVIKHSRASSAQIIGSARDDHMVLVVRDDGIGGASPERGTGLQGLADRVAVVGGSMAVSSPPGGPTELRVELPWETPDFG
ncbi:Histidine kinase [Streptoalloteichus tenebrarius]|uniref:histidine kinase n=1 Tax=Streptoalloteichus tenebrarius (strain ATCC 17920 / DSM 40477 / JCM 4838 / CBS 697.72 / NBRC 16177 / NCIMB 11028 / NRRL B-12390 / A12253. 1 / ISP 5477) TaxID=1933 RepID=A0ABT1HLP9_STRSD|nr:histidine kinase [Streptoalloteichus tenebrarius]MCP2256433.1 Histidine kinase [Streptoalloteichus tenebrarius]BFF04785.1 sensor histidine kinase [Streptoalloteichus tenebrarius]